MRTFYFKAKTIGDEKYLTYTMGEDCELDEDVLDYCQENKPAELIDIIYEEDDDYDYLTYDISGRVSLQDYIANEIPSSKVLLLLRNIANGLISLKEQTIHLNYVLMNRSFIYVDDECNAKFLCVPVESKGAVAVEFKGFVRELLANMKYDVEEDLNYVGKLITYINGENFNLRGLIGLSEALMEEGGISFEAASGIETDGGEVVDAEPEVTQSLDGVADFMNSSDSDEPLPEIGDDEDDEVTEVKPANAPAEKAEAPANEAAKQAEDKKETDLNVIKSRLMNIVGDNSLTPPTPAASEEPKTIKTIDDLDSFLNKAPVVKKNVVKVNRAALIQSAAEHEGEEEAVSEIKDTNAPTEAQVEEISADMNVDKPKSNSILSKSVETKTTSTLINAPKAVPYLIRINTEERIMLNKAVFKLGKATRGVDYTVGGNGAISRQHAIITQKDGVCFIKDNKSTNHTYVNDKVVEDGVDEILTHDSIIRLGDEEFRFKIR